MSKDYCIFSAQYYPHVGGVERYTLYLSRKLIAAGNKVTIVTSNTGNLSGDEIQEGIQIYRLPCYDLLGGRYPVFKKNKEFKKVEKLIRMNQYDLVIINTRFYLHSLYGAKFAKSKGIPSIVIEHGTSHLSVNNKLFDTVGGWYEHFLTFLLKKYCDDYYGVSEACCEWSGHFHIKSKGTLYNAVEIEEFQRILKESDIDYRKEYEIPNEAKVISFTGRLIPEKGIKQLVSAVKKINISRTKKGQAMLAVSEDKGAAQLMGINVNKTISITFAIGSGLAAIAGVLLCSAYPSLTPYTGAMPGIKAFVAAVFGGIGSIPGAFIGGVVLGILEIFGKAYISSQMADAIVFGVLIVVLVVKPTGILGKNIQEKV